MAKGAILIVEDDAVQRRLVRQTLEGEGYQVAEAATVKETLEALAAAPVEVAVVDFKLDGETGLDVIDALRERNPLVTPIMVTAFGNLENAVEAMRRGAYDYVTKPIEFPRFLEVIERARERWKLKTEIDLLHSSLEETFSAKNFVYASARMQAVARLIRKAASSDATVLLSGETGTGKDLVARTVHFSSKRKAGPFLAVNLPSLPESLVESELFGAEKGAYTGALERKTGRFEAAAGGTLYLDEIGDLPTHIQVKLLRVLQDGEFYRLGSSRPLRADVRIIAATHRDLPVLLKEEKFRSDLYYRLNVIRIETPPLRERREDIPPLVDHFIRKYREREGKPIEGVSREAMEVLMAYAFPGNVRELENVIERAVVFAEGDLIGTADLPVFLEDKSEAAAVEGSSLPDQVRSLEIREIKRALAANGGVQSRAARSLGVSERILGYKIKTYGIKPGS
ncbi:MAG: sigma-54-dependent Fis family transcriptional regulator [Candidatus Aminicenantes bacterium]|nr:sigma-54-dependent Fis family transcriptional regulator [Candidatus Aminicenantes bacterium]